MKKTSSKLSEIEYYYSVSKPTWNGMLYEDALRAKIELAKHTISVLLQKSFLTRDTIRINDCLKAIQFNEKLLKELI